MAESLVSAVIRETREETSYEFTPEFITGIHRWQHPTPNKTYIRVCFGGTYSGFDADAKLEEGIIKTVWLSREQLLHYDKPLRSPMVMQCIDDYLTGRRYPLTLFHDLD